MKRILLFISIIVPLVSNAQTENKTVSISLEQAIHIGLQNRFDNKANQLNIEIAKTKIFQAKNNWLPEIQVAADLKYSPQLQNSVIPGGVLPGFDQTKLLPLTVKNQSVFGLQLEQPIFNASLGHKKRMAENELKMQQEKIKEQEIQIKLLISQAYMNVQLRALQRKIAVEIVARNTEYASIAEGKYKSGSLIENFYLRAKLDKDNAKNQLQHATQEYEIGMARLRYCLNLPDKVVLELSDSLDIKKDVTTGLTLNQVEQRPELKQLLVSQEANVLNIKSYRQGLLPTVSLAANYSQQFLSTHFDYGKSKWWSPFSYVMLQLRIPISEHHKNKSHIAEHRQRVTQTEFLIAQKSADIHYEVSQAQAVLENSITNMNSSRSNYELSKTIFQNQRQQYRIGAFDYTELLNTEKTLSSTERNFIESAYELLLARINLLKATNQF